jgi:hypothetical protein
MRYVAQYPSIQVAAAVEGIAKLHGVGIPGHRVYRKIPPGKRLVDRHAGIGLSLRARKGCVVGGPAGGNGKIDWQTLQLEDLEGFSDELDGEVLGQQSVDVAGRQSDDFNVQIPRLSTEREIADRAANQPDSSSPTANGVFDTSKNFPEVGIVKTKAGRHLDPRFAEECRSFFR